MPESRLLSTVTFFSILGSDIEITSIYLQEGLPNTISAKIIDQPSVENFIPFIQGELSIRVKNSPDQINYQVDSDGNLILFVNTGDEDKYSIDDDGNLIYELSE